jgi:ACT domain-containing protein
LIEPKTEIIIVGHILEKGIVFKLYEAIKNIDVDVKHCDISFTTLKEGIEERKPSTMRFYLVGPKEEREKAIKEIEKLAEENDCGVEKVDYDKLWAKT